MVVRSASAPSAVSSAASSSAALRVVLVVDVDADVGVVVVRLDDLAGGAVGEQFEEPGPGVGAVPRQPVVREDDAAVALARHRDGLTLGLELLYAGHDLGAADGRQVEVRARAVADVDEALAHVHRGDGGVALLEFGLRERCERRVPSTYSPCSS